jgi:hypothetical protein
MKDTRYIELLEQQLAELDKDIKGIRFKLQKMIGDKARVIELIESEKKR